MNRNNMPHGLQMANMFLQNANSAGFMGNLPYVNGVCGFIVTTTTTTTTVINQNIDGEDTQINITRVSKSCVTFGNPLQQTIDNSGKTTNRNDRNYVSNNSNTCVKRLGNPPDRLNHNKRAKRWYNFRENNRRNGLERGRQRGRQRGGCRPNNNRRDSFEFFKQNFDQRTRNGSRRFQGNR